MERTWQALSVDQSQVGRISFGRLLRQTNGAYMSFEYMCDHVCSVSFVFDLLQIILLDDARKTEWVKY